MADNQHKPRLLVITSTYPRWQGDTEPSFVHDLASRLTDRFDVVVSTSRAPGAKSTEIMDSVRVVRYHYAPAGWESLVYGGGLSANLKAAPWKLLLLPSYLLAWTWQAWQLRRELGADVVHAHWFFPGALIAAISCGKTPYCITAHGTDVLGLKGSLWKCIRRFAAEPARTITAVGTRVQDQLETEGISNVRLLPMGVDLLHTFHPDFQLARSMRALYVGRLTSSKRPSVAVLAFSKALQNIPELMLDVVGDGPELGALQQLAEKLGIQSKLHFHGRKDQKKIAAMFRSAAVLICPSGGDDAPEGLGLVAVEALGCDCPVASAPNLALQAAIPQAAPIHYATDSGAGALSKAMLRALRDPGRTTGSTSQWRKGLFETFSWEHVAREYGDILEELAKSKRR